MKPLTGFEDVVSTKALSDIEISPFNTESAKSIDSNLGSDQELRCIEDLEHNSESSTAATSPQQSPTPIETKTKTFFATMQVAKFATQSDVSLC